MVEDDHPPRVGDLGVPVTPEIDAAMSRIDAALDPGWRTELSYSPNAGWRVHVVSKTDPGKCAKTLSGRSPAHALLRLEQVVGAVP